MHSQDQRSGREKVKKLSTIFKEPVTTGTIKSNDILESSGLVVSPCNPEVLWTHNDSGDKNTIFALNKKAEILGEWRVSGAVNRDWEDIAAYKDKDGKCFLYLGDIGNNSRLRGEMRIFKVREPTVSASKQSGTLDTENAETITFEYPDLRHDAEALFVQPKTGTIYVITKRMSGAAGVYKLETGNKTAVKVADIEVPSLPNGLITGADISQDGSHVILCDYFGGYEFALLDDAKAFDDIWKTKPKLVDIGTRKQGEAVAYSIDGMSVFSTSEKADSPLFEAKRKE